MQAAVHKLAATANPDRFQRPCGRMKDGLRTQYETRNAYAVVGLRGEEREAKDPIAEFFHVVKTANESIWNNNRLDKRHVYALRVHGKPSPRDGNPPRKLRAHWLHESSNPGVEPNKYFAANGHPYGEIFPANRTVNGGAA